jgi:hypothetical protein
MKTINFRAPHNGAHSAERNARPWAWRRASGGAVGPRLRQRAMPLGGDPPLSEVTADRNWEERLGKEAGVKPAELRQSQRLERSTTAAAVPVWVAAAGPAQDAPRSHQPTSSATQPATGMPPQTCYSAITPAAGAQLLLKEKGRRESAGPSQDDGAPAASRTVSSKDKQTRPYLSARDRREMTLRGFGGGGNALVSPEPRRTVEQVRPSTAGYNMLPPTRAVRCARAGCGRVLAEQLQLPRPTMRTPRAPVYCLQCGAAGGCLAAHV